MLERCPEMKEFGMIIYRKGIDMKQIYILRFIILVWGWTSIGVFSSCSEDEKVSSDPEATVFELPIVFDTKATASSVMQYAMYIFEQEDSGAYLLKDSLILTEPTGHYTFNEKDWLKKNYRFLFTGTPASEAEISTLQTGNSSLTEGTEWKDVVLTCKKAAMSEYNYCTVEDMSGQDILNQGIIKCKMERIVGKMVFDFFKAQDGVTPLQPVDIASEDVLSVMDRLKSIEVVYTGLISSLTFDETNKLIPVASTAVDNTITQLINIENTSELKVTIPQEEIGLIGVDNIKGAVRLVGWCFFPTSENMDVTLTFTYYDTTPIYRNQEEHSEGYFKQKTLVLHLKDQNNTQVLRIVADRMVRNKIGIHCDRIIDVPVNSGLNIDVEWNKDNDIN